MNFNYLSCRVSYSKKKLDCARQVQRNQAPANSNLANVGYLSLQVLIMFSFAQLILIVIINTMLVMVQGIGNFLRINVIY